MSAAKQIDLSPEELAWAEERAAQNATTVEAVVHEALRKQREAEARARYFEESDLDELTLEGVKEAIREMRGEKAD